MRNFLANIKTPMVVSFLLVLPFIMLELINRRTFNDGFPVALFVILWLLPAIFILILTLIVRSARAGNNVMANPVSLLIRVVLFAILAFLWVSLLNDQMPCFLGVPNCD